MYYVKGAFNILNGAVEYQRRKLHAEPGLTAPCSSELCFRNFTKANLVIPPSLKGPVRGMWLSYWGHGKVFCSGPQLCGSGQHGTQDRKCWFVCLHLGRFHCFRGTLNSKPHTLNRLFNFCFVQVAILRSNCGCGSSLWLLWVSQEAIKIPQSADLPPGLTLCPTNWSTRRT